jgi:hypothetical protein
LADRGAIDDLRRRHMAKMDLISLMTYRPDAANDPNDAYAVIPTPA